MKRNHPARIALLLFMLTGISGCGEDTLFRLLPSEKTGIDFSNDLVTDDTFNAVFFEYIYNGGGVAAGDVNGDGLTDLFFSGNQVSSRLYLNRGGMRFEDVTEAAGVSTSRWCTGVAMADVNDDGRLDIYVSVAGFEVPPEEMANYLFINQGVDEAGVPRFHEAAAAYGLDDRGYSTQAAFFDYDLDGDLDMYLLTNAMETFNRNTLRPKRVQGEAESTDRLYRNNGDGTFTNVSREAGILIEGYGLGIQVSDLNFDGYPDVYAANDFLSNDLVWVNNGDGTFTNKAGEYLKHQTHNGMGVDIADINNDQLPDIAVLDMLPMDNYRQKMMLSNSNTDLFLMKQEMGYQDQYMRNTLQLHRGFLPDRSPRFSEIGFQAGIAGTDWSWAVLFADLDLDGWKDAFISNGYRKDITNLDYIKYSNANQMFGTAESKQEKAIAVLDNAPDVKISNFAFRNRGDLTFEDVTRPWGFFQPSFSNGAVYADLDQDGDLDLVTNNIDEKAFIYENRQRNLGEQPPHYLKILLQEAAPDLTSFNAKVWVYHDGNSQYQELSPFRGYKSTVEPALYFGLGSSEKVDSVVVRWLNGAVSKNSEIAADQVLTVSYDPTSRKSTLPRPGMMTAPLFREAAADLQLTFQHQPHLYSELNTTRTLPHEHSKMGPPITTADINGDGLEDAFIGGNTGQPGTFFIQSPDGTFQQKLLPFDAACKDTGCLFFDADQDGDADLYIVSGGTHLPAGDPGYQDRLYWNDGEGNFSKAPLALPALTASGSCVKAADFDRDGDLDLFIGGRITPGLYPMAARSFLLENQNGQFSDITPESLQKPGLVTDAVWTDFDGDQQKDLILVGEWMPVTFFRNNGKTLEPASTSIRNADNEMLQPTEGWWFHINAADLDQDGDEDYLLGNMGLNNKLCPSPEEPIQLFAKDFDDNGAVDPLLACYIQGKQYLMHQRDLLIDQIPSMKRRFPNYDLYARATVEQSLSEKERSEAYTLVGYTFTSSILENTGNNQYLLRELPEECQMAPIMASAFLDINQDGKKDLVTAGNFHATEVVQLGWQDASYGNLLINQGRMNFTPLNPLSAGFVMDGDIRSLHPLKYKNRQVILLGGAYAGPLRVFLLPQKALPQ